MNDRFRFRAWYQPSWEEHRMLYDVEQTYDFLRGTPESVPAESFGEVLEDSNFIVMQCTGMEDDKGQLIYEGDIVEIWKMCGNIRKRMVVKWRDTQCGFRLYDLTAMGATPQKLLPYEKRSMGAVTSIKIIGNAYENKELLNEN